jgi:hypothetical protein
VCKEDPSTKFLKESPSPVDPPPLILTDKFELTIRMELALFGVKVKDDPKRSVHDVVFNV